MAGTATAEAGTADIEGDSTEVGTTDIAITTPDIIDTTAVGVGSPVDIIPGGCFRCRFPFLTRTTVDITVQDMAMDMERVTGTDTD